MVADSIAATSSVEHHDYRMLKLCRFTLDPFQAYDVSTCICLSPLSLIDTVLFHFITLAVQH